MKGDIGGYGDERGTLYDDRHIRARARRTSRGELKQKKNKYFIYLFNVI
jgi:hypothetical protein